MLFWEADHPDYGEVHHLMVLCYHLQHPSLYSPEGLQFGMHLLVDFLERGLKPEQARRRNASLVDSSQRDWKIKGTAASQGAYSHPIIWKMTAIDVVAHGEAHYPDSVRNGPTSS
jgi:hypothetical protein